MPLSTSLGNAEREQSGARARPMRGLGGRGRLVELDGGKWGLMAQWWSMASLRSLRPMGVCPGHARERGRGQGEVSVVSLCRVGSSGAGVGVLITGWG
jgi:hypothetical protein